ncbi:MAG TPA: type VI secretion system lipoprotein TssJ [bacterium]|nr:type VI secretion system lipoprotein TssJ [bacterium]
MISILDRAHGLMARGGRASFLRPLGLVLFLLALALCFPGCTPKKQKVEELKKWPFESKGIRLSYKADPNLNMYNEQSHTLAVCVYQLIDPNAFNALKIDQAGVVKLLECKRFDESVASSEKLIIHPGDEETVAFDRAEDARFFALVGGYYNLWPGHVSKLMLIPVRIETTGFIVKKRAFVPAELNVTLFFGPEEIQQILEEK